MDPHFLNKSCPRVPHGKKSGFDGLLDNVIKPKVIVALVGAVATVVIALLSLLSARAPNTDVSTAGDKRVDTSSALSSVRPPIMQAQPMSEPSLPVRLLQEPAVVIQQNSFLNGMGKLEGVVKDQNGNPLSGVRVGIQHARGAEDITDQNGVFVFTNLTLGDIVLVLKPPSERGQLMQHVQATNLVSQVTVVYDAQSSKLALLSIVAPVDDGLVLLRRSDSEHRAIVYGRCDGLSDILQNFDVWILLRSERDRRFWVQDPPAIIDRVSGTWSADVLFGSPERPPSDEERWHIVVVAAPSSSDMRRLENVVYLTDLPPHISGNAVTVKTKIQP
jgi:hypothetical protein